MADGWFWRYSVVGIEGVVPDSVRELLDDPDGHLLYPEDRGEWSMQHFMRGHKVVGGWTMARDGRCRTVGSRVVEVDPEKVPASARAQASERAEGDAS